MRTSFLFMPEGDGGGAGGAAGAGAAGAGAAGAGAPTTILDGAPTGGTGGAGAAPTDWKQAWPEEFRTDPTLAPFLAHETEAEARAALAKGYKETKSFVGKKFELPHEKSTPEEITDFKKRMGAPLKPEDYGESLRPEAIPAEQWKPETEKAVREIALKHHMTPAAVKDLMDLYGTTTKAGLDQYEEGERQYLTTQINELKTEWKESFDSNLTLAKRFAATIGLKPDDAIFTNANAVRAMVRGARLISESSLVPGTPAGNQGGNAARAAAIMDPKNQELLARQYRGELGHEQQNAAQDVLNQLLAAKAA